MSIDLFDPEIQFAVEAACAAGRMARTIQDSMTVAGVEKSDLSPVTVGDFSCQAIVAKALHDQFDDAVLVGEEDSDILRKQRDVLEVVTKFVRQAIPKATEESVCDWIDGGNGESCDRFWTLDPIDGTKGYLRGEQYAVALALIESGKVTLGVLVCPNLGVDCSMENDERGVVVVAKRGKGCWRASMDSPANFERITVSAESDIRQARLMRSVEAAHTNTGQMGELVDAMGVVAEPIRMDSQAKYAVLAAGGGELLLRLLSPSRPDYREMIWDQAAGSIVLEEAGGQITDLAGKTLDFGQGTTLAANRGVCASNGQVHDAALAALSQ
jgi:3'(2'), 5'-bisphosphate nucleotidase